MKGAAPSDMSLTVHVLGAGRDVGRSCLLATLNERQIMLDCGAHPGFADDRRFPVLATLAPSAALISHFHVDHAAAIPLLPADVPVFMTAPTRDLARLMLADFIRTSRARRQPCPFDEAVAERALDRVRLVELGVPFRIPGAPELRAEALRAGHVLGAVMFRVWVVPDGPQLLYSGDYSTRAARHLAPAQMPRACAPDLFITEATYCATARTAPRAERERELVTAAAAACRAGGKVLVPVSAFGRAQEVCAVFAAHAVAAGLDDVPVYFAEGLASKANVVYDAHRAWGSHATAEGAEGVREFSARIRPFNRNEHWNVVVERPGPVILFATPGNISTGLSLDVFKAWAADSRNAVIVPGISVANALAGQVLSSSAKTVRCRLVNMALSQHADARGIVRACRAVEARAVMLVHGEEDKVLNFQKILGPALGVPCFAPANGEVVKIQVMSGAERSGVFQNKHAELIASMPAEWQELVRNYLNGPGVCGGPESTSNDVP